MTLSGRRLVEEIIDAAQEKLAESLTVMDLQGTAAACDFFIIVQSETTVQNTAICDAVANRCAERGSRPWHIEGEQEGRWILMDFSDVVVHILLPDLRAYYGLETLWTGAKRTDITGS